MTGAGTDEHIPKADSFKETYTHQNFSPVPVFSLTNLASANPVALYIVTYSIKDT